jgi:hypothetical protein
MISQPTVDDLTLIWRAYEFILSLPVRTEVISKVNQRSEAVAHLLGSEPTLLTSETSNELQLPATSEQCVQTDLNFHSNTALIQS